MTVRRVSARGAIFWKHEPVFVSETLMGERVGLEPEDDRYWTVYFAEFPIGRFDSRDLRVNAMKNVKR